MVKISPKEISWLLRDKYHGQKTPAFFGDIERLKEGEPLHYVIGWREFLGCQIDLSERPLIPRVETEFWVEQVIKKLKTQSVKRKTETKKSKLKILDIFSGSGCVGLAVLKHCQRSEVTFIDSKENCVKQIKKNLKINKLKGKVLLGDIFNIKNSVGKFDFILANPPYVPKVGPGSRVQTSTSRYEPASALWAGDDGLDIIRRFLADARKHLVPDGEIWLEFGSGQKTKIEKIIKQNNYTQWNFFRDQFDRWRFVVITA